MAKVLYRVAGLALSGFALAACTTEVDVDKAFCVTKGSDVGVAKVVNAVSGETTMYMDGADIHRGRQIGEPVMVINGREFPREDDRLEIDEEAGSCTHTDGRTGDRTIYTIDNNRWKSPLLSFS